MARDDKVWRFAQEAGYGPMENRCIIVQYALRNLSEKIAKFFQSNQFYVLQMCKSELILLPFDALSNLKKDVALVLPYQDIRAVSLADEMLNTVITIQTDTDTIRLSAQQEALSDYRTSGVYATQYIGGIKNWHKENLEDTLKALMELNP